jgi:hypothetical protein
MHRRCPFVTCCRSRLSISTHRWQVHILHDNNGEYNNGQDYTSYVQVVGMHFDKPTNNFVLPHCSTLSLTQLLSKNGTTITRSATRSVRSVNLRSRSSVLAIVNGCWSKYHPASVYSSRTADPNYKYSKAVDPSSGTPPALAKARLPWGQKFPWVASSTWVYGDC